MIPAGSKPGCVLKIGSAIDHTQIMEGTLQEKTHMRIMHVLPNLHSILAATEHGSGISVRFLMNIVFIWLSDRSTKPSSMIPLWDGNNVEAHPNEASLCLRVSSNDQKLAVKRSSRLPTPPYHLTGFCQSGLRASASAGCRTAFFCCVRIAFERQAKPYSRFSPILDAPHLPHE